MVQAASDSRVSREEPDRLFRDLNAIPEADLKAIEVLYETGAHEDALATAEVLLALHPENVALVLLRGGMISELGYPYQAAESFRRLTELAPAEGEGWGRLGRELIRIGDLVEARTAMEKALVLDLNDADDWTFNLGHIALLEGDRERAHCRYREAVAHIRSQFGLEQALAGFDDLIASGWQVEALTAERGWVRWAFDAMVRYEAALTGGAHAPILRRQLLRGESIEDLANPSAVSDGLARALRVLVMNAEAAAEQIADEGAEAAHSISVRLPDWLVPAAPEEESLP